MYKNEISKMKKIIITALLVAAFVVLDRELAINTQFVAINLSIITVMIAARLLGPKYSVLVAVLGDLIGALLIPFGPYFVGFTITSGIAGLIYGVILYKKDSEKKDRFILKVIISNILVLIFVSLLLNSLNLKIMYRKAFSYYLGLRITTQTLMCPIQIVLMIFLDKALAPIAKKYLYKEEKISIEEYLSTFQKFTKNPTLDAMEYLTKEFDFPQNKVKCIHIAGTNGKGSVAEMLSRCLEEAGYKVGKFISPHLITFNDGILINGKEIKTSEVEKILIPLSEKIEEYNKTHKMKVTWFEVITMVALIYFAENNCDFAVIETGLGGALDSTNIVNSEIAVLTNIGYDHMDILGDTIQKITVQKAGIIKPNSETVTVKEKDTIKVIEEYAKKQNARLHIVSDENINNYVFDGKNQRFDYKEHNNIKINLKGKVQTINASEVLEVIDILNEKGYKISEEAIKKGLSSVVHKARMEELSQKPLIVFDGGHNENAAKNLISNINQYYAGYKKVFIVSILKTKDYKTVIKEITKEKDATYILTSGNDVKRYVSKNKLFNEAKKYVDKKNLVKLDFLDAVNYSTTNYKDAAIFIVGSFYVYKDITNFLKGM